MSIAYWDFVIRYFSGISQGITSVKTIADIITSIVSFMTGYIYFAFFFVIIYQMLISMGTSSTKYEMIMNQVNEYMKHKQLPIEMQERLVSFYEYKFQKRYFREVGIANALSGVCSIQFALIPYFTHLPLQKG